MSKYSNGISLASQANELGIKADDASRFDEMDLRRELARRLQHVFLGLNVVTVVLVGVVAGVEMYTMHSVLGREDATELCTIVAGNRLVSSEVMMAFIGATVVQTGTMVWIMTRYFFSSKQTADAGNSGI